MTARDVMIGAVAGALVTAVSLTVSRPMPPPQPKPVTVTVIDTTPSAEPRPCVSPARRVGIAIEHAVERVYRAHLAREGLTTRIEHTPR